MNLMSFIFTIVILFVLVGGSLWIMFSLHSNMMMPGTMPMDHAMPMNHVMPMDHTMHNMP